jgi:hypothetical protein
MKQCRKCGCTPVSACFDPRTDTTCHWIERDLCSFCADAPNGAILVRADDDEEPVLFR